MSTTDEILAIAEAAEAADGAAPLDEATLIGLRDGLAHVHRRDGGAALLVGDELTLVVHPDQRGHGVGDALLRDVPAAPPGVRRTAWSHGDHPAAAALAARHGWARVRDLWVMRRPASVALPALAAPDGVTLRPWTDQDAESLVRVNAAAFADHPEQGRMDLANLRRRMAEPWFDPAGLILAVDASDGRLLAFHWTKMHAPSANAPAHGEVYVVGVDPEEQGRGIGKLVTLAGLHHLAQSQIDEIVLYVESDNTPAVATYTRLGFTHEARDTHVQYAQS